MCGIQDAVTKGKVDEAVNMLYGVIRRAGWEMEIKTRKFKEWDYWYDEQCTGKRRDVKMALKEYKKRDDGKSKNRCSCKKEYVKLLEEKNQRWQEKKSEQMNYLIKQKDARKIWVTVKNILRTHLNTETLNSDSC